MLVKIIAIIICLLYNTYGFIYIKKILPDFKKLPFFCIAIIANTVFIFFSYTSSSYYTTYVASIILLTTEVVLLSKAKFCQAFFIATILTLSIILVQMQVTVLLSWYYKIIPLEVRLDENLYYTSLIITMIIDLLLLFLFRKITIVEDIQSISTTHPYSIMISSIAVVIIIYSCIFSSLLMTLVSYPNTVLIIISNCTLSSVLFYLLFAYNVKLHNLGFLKKRFGDLTEEYENRQNHLKDLKKLIFIDTLTGCYSRVYAEEYIAKLSQNTQNDYCVVYIDIDKLKRVNDKFGHTEGDQYIKNVCTLITQHLRTEDILARLGGDEFILFLNFTTSGYADAIMLRIENHIKQWNQSHTTYPMNISYGIMCTNSTKDQMEVRKLINMADKQMLKQKMKKASAGKNKENTV